jgi:hypothetical protein
MTRTIELPAFIEPDEGGDVIPAEQCRRVDIEAEIAWTDSISRRRELRALLRRCGDHLHGTTTVREALAAGGYFKQPEK